MKLTEILLMQSAQKEGVMVVYGQPSSTMQLIAKLFSARIKYTLIKSFVLFLSISTQVPWHFMWGNWSYGVERKLLAYVLFAIQIFVQITKR